MQTATFLHTVTGTFSLTHSLTKDLQVTCSQTVLTLKTLRQHSFAGTSQQTRVNLPGLQTVRQVAGSNTDSLGVRAHWVLVVAGMV